MKPRSKHFYAVVDKKRPTISALEIYGDTEVKLAKGEELWVVEVTAVKLYKKKKTA